MLSLRYKICVGIFSLIAVTANATSPPVVFQPPPSPEEFLCSANLVFIAHAVDVVTGDLCPWDDKSVESSCRWKFRNAVVRVHVDAILGARANVSRALKAGDTADIPVALHFDKSYGPSSGPVFAIPKHVELPDELLKSVYADKFIYTLHDNHTVARLWSIDQKAWAIATMRDAQAHSKLCSSPK